jgi:hypothetical protein
MIYDIDPEPEASSTPESMTRRQLRSIERANEYLQLQAEMMESALAHKKAYPGQPLLSVVDADGVLLDETNASTRTGPGRPVDMSVQLGAQRAVIDMYRESVAAGDWFTIGELNDKWLEMQPNEADQEPMSLARFQKIGLFVAKVFNRSLPAQPEDKFAVALHEAAHRQDWMNNKVAKLDAYTEDQSKKAA